MQITPLLFSSCLFVYSSKILIQWAQKNYFYRAPYRVLVVLRPHLERCYFYRMSGSLGMKGEGRAVTYVHT